MTTDVTVRPIRSEADHAAALKRIEALWGASPDTPEGDELDVLAALVWAFEEATWPMDHASPAAVIWAHLDAHGADASELAKLVGEEEADRILTRDGRPTAEQARMIANGYGLDPRRLISSQG